MVNVNPKQLEVMAKSAVGHPIERLTGSFTAPPEDLRLFLAAMPKSGSTYLSRLIGAYFGAPVLPYGYAGGRSTQHIYPPAAVVFAGTSSTAYLHASATEDNVNIIEALRFRPIVLVRNILDGIVSYRDHIAKTKGGHDFLNLKSIDVAGFLAAGDGAQIDLLIDLALPWFVNFYASWYRYTEQARAKPLWLSYETAFADQAAMLETLAGNLGRDFDPAAAGRVIAEVSGNKEKLRFNKGATGRGAALLSERQLARIQAVLAHFPQVDFEAHGFLPKAPEAPLAAQAG